MIKCTRNSVAIINNTLELIVYMYVYTQASERAHAKTFARQYFVKLHQICNVHVRGHTAGMVGFLYYNTFVCMCSLLAVNFPMQWSSPRG